MKQGHRVVGHPVERLDGYEKVTGQAMYSADHAWPGTLHGVVKRSERAHARILDIDVSAALGRPGVRAVVTRDSLGGISPYFGHHRADHPILAIDKVRFWGEPVAVVVADSRVQAADAVEHIEVRYQDLDSVMDIHAAMSPGAALVHEPPVDLETRIGPCVPGRPGSNEGFITEMGWGDVPGAFSRADHVVTTHSHFPMLYAYAMEPYSAHARYHRGRLEVLSCAQHPFQVQRELARMFDLGLHQVRVQVPFIGGGFGSKSYTKLEPLAAACSKAVGGRAVKIVLDIEESMYTTRADGALVEVRTALTTEGRILARDIRVALDTGAYADNSPQVLQRAVVRAFGPYRMEALRVRGHGIFTNTVPASSYRGFGTHHTNAASELNLDRAAHELGLGSFDIRSMNLVRRGEQLTPDLRPVDVDMVANLELLRESLSIDVKEGVSQGMGFGVSISDNGSRPLSNAIVRLLADGTAVLLVGSAEMGQGSRTALAQIVAEELGLQLAQVAVVQSDTDATPFQWSTGSSRTTTLAGLSVMEACADLRRKLCRVAADLAGAAPEDYTWSAGAVLGPDGEEAGPVDLMEAWFGGPWGELVGVGATSPRKDLARGPAVWEMGMVGVTVDIDLATGEVQVDQLVSVADVGKAVNIAAIHGQEMGAAMQGIGSALFEELIYDGGQLLNANMIEYRVPRMTDLARRVTAHVVERGDGIGPYGLRGVGEGAITTAGTAVLAAVAQATNRWPTRAPLTPERLWSLVQHQDEPPMPDGEFFPAGLAETDT